MFQPVPCTGGSPRRARVATLSGRILIWLPALLILLTLLPSGGMAGITLVSSEADDGGVGTLRSRIGAANQDDVISFALGINQIQFMRSTDDPVTRVLPVEVDTDMTIDGAGRVSVTAVEGKIFEVDAKLTLKDLTILGGMGTEVALDGGAELVIETSLEDGAWGNAMEAAPITGAGKLTKTGSHSFNLYGTHAYEGDTEIQDGSLFIFDASDLDGDFIFNKRDPDADLDPDEDHDDDHPHLYFIGDQNGTTISGAVRDTGDVRGHLVKSTEGFLTFSSSLGIDADIFIEDGILNVSAVPLGNLNLSDGGVIEFDLNTDHSYGGIISGPGGIAKLGSGVLVLNKNADSSWTGLTRVEDGTLKVTDTATLPNHVFFTGVGNLEFNIDSDKDFEHDITEEDVTGVVVTGTVVKDGDGKLTLKGNNSYSNLIIKDGKVIGDTKSIKGAVDLETAAVELIFEQAFSGTHTGDISGPGLIRVRGAGTVTLSGTNSYMGGTNVTEGATLQGDHNSLQSNLDPKAGGVEGIHLQAENSKLIFNQATDGAFEGLIDGLGSVEKIGSGTLTIGSAQTYEGVTAVSAGGLILESDGWLYKDVVGGGVAEVDVEVASGARLGGNGTITGTVDVSGALAPYEAGEPDLSDPDRTLTVEGDVNFLAQSSLEVAVDEVEVGDDKVAVAGQLDVTGGSVTIDPSSSLIVSLGPGDYAGTTELTILQGTFTGEFDVPGDDYAFLNVGVEQTSPRIVVTVEQDPDQTIAGVAGLNHNQQTVGAALDAADILNGDAGADLSAAFRTLFFAEVPNAVNQLSGLSISSTFSARIAEGKRFGRTLARRMRVFADGGNDERDWSQAKRSFTGSGSLLAGALIGGPSSSGSFGPAGSPGWGGWFDGYGAFGSVDGDAKYTGFDYSIAGIAAGVDHQFDVPLLLGAAFAYAHSTIDAFTSGDAKGTGNTYRTSLYGAYSHRLGYLSMRADYAYADFENRRRVDLAPIQETVTGNFGGNEFTGALELGTRPFERWQVRARPFLSLEYTYLGRDAFSETNPITDSEIALDVALESYNALTLGIGTTLDHTTQLSQRLKLRTELRLRYDHEILDHRPTTRAAFDGQKFEIQGVSTGAHTGLIGIGVEFIDRYNLSTFIGYDLRINTRLLEHNINAGVLVYF